jgi:hypothetical protein
MVDRLYVARGDRTFGPFSSAQLRGLAATGRLQLTDLLWREGTEKRVLASTVQNLFPAPQAREPLPDAGAGADEPPAPPPSVVSVPGPAPAVEPDGSLPEPPDTLVPLGPSGPAPDAPKAKPPRPPLEPPKKRRAVGLKGAILLAQDGVSVQYRKKCWQCGFEDGCRSSMRIGQGVVRAHFYCPKCRKNRDVQIQGTLQ